ncbi:BppU family phage baseplate upper protein [Bacillus sp. NPDC077411]|uniref:BppU family phage baseplate upper protein n=1 Tax=Bacillus sp. NPDC077411 TaxID=3363947 RepID=UPI0037CC7A6B
MKIKLILDVNKSENAQLNYIVTGRAGDVASNIVDVYIVDGGNPYPLTNLGVFYECTKPDNTVIRDSTGVNIIDATAGHFEYTFPKETFNIPGRSKRAFFAIEKDKVIRATTQDFIIVSLPNALDGNIQSAQYISDLEKLIADGNKMLSGLNSQAAAMQTKINDLNKQISTMDVVKKTGDTMTGALISTSDLPVISKKAAKKSWTLHHPNTDEFILAPSLSADGIDWDWNHGFKFSPDGKMFLSGLEVATQKFITDSWKQKYQVTTDDGYSINLASGTDLNDIIKNGFYRGTGLINTPTNDAYWYIQVFAHADNNYACMQVAYSLNNSNNKSLYVRKKAGGVWTSWERHLTSSDFGGNGSATTASRSDHNHDDIYIKKPNNDTDWVNLTLINSVTVDGGKTPRYKLHNNVVYIDGGVAGIKDNTSITTLPANIRPSRDLTFPLTYLSGDGKKYIGELTARTDGRLTTDWLWNTPQSAAFCISYHL